MFFDDKLLVRIGKSVPTYDFNNVVRSVPMNDPAGNISAVSSALFTPLYVNPTLLGVIPGYYNSATGVVATLAPSKNFYAEYGFFDGNLARGRQLGLEGPHFNGYWLHLVEAGANWTIGAEKKPGAFGVGAWFQTGRLTTFSGTPVDGAQGVYLFGSQRLYYKDRKKNNNGLSAFYQFGATDSNIVFVHRYLGCGLTYIGPLPGREEDSLGFAYADGYMTGDPHAGAPFFTPRTDALLRTDRLGKGESILTWYYQWKLVDGAFFQPNLTYIPDPARHPGIPSAFALTLRMIVLF